MKMRKIFYALSLIALFLTINSSAQSAAKPNVALEAAMKKFINAIETKNTVVFLSFVSPAKGLTVMNTIDQGEAGNADKPMLDSKLEYKKLAADFKKKGDYYRDIFLPSPDSPNFHDGFAKRKEKWMLVEGDKFQIVDAETGEPSNAFYVKWEKTGTRWFVTEVGRMIS
jgi:hypothetical protein